MDEFRTMILPAAVTPLAREIANTLSTAAQGMWTTGLSPTGAEPATPYISSGFITPEFAFMVPEQFWAQDEAGEWIQTGSTPGDPVAVYEACTAAGMMVTQDEIDAVFAVADVTEQEPFVAMGRMGLVLVQESIDGN